VGKSETLASCDEDIRVLEAEWDVSDDTESFDCPDNSECRYLSPLMIESSCLRGSDDVLLADGVFVRVVSGVLSEKPLIECLLGIHFSKLNWGVILEPTPACGLSRVKC
jgi:hypothetical protein